MNVGVVGLGQIACDKMIPAIQASAKARLVALCDSQEERLGVAGRQFGVSRLFVAYDEMLAQPDVDIIYVATPNHLHVPQSVQALEAGKHVLCEKAMALSAAEAMQAVEAARRAGRMLSINTMSRFHPLNIEARRLYASGAIGKLLYARAFFSWRMPESRVAEWRLDPSHSGGGPLMDVGIYTLHILRVLTGQSVGTLRAVLGYERGFRTSDVALAVGRLEDGTPVSLESSYDHGYAATESGFDLVGELGALRARGVFGQWPTGSLTVETTSERREVLLQNELLPHYYCYQQSIEHLCDCIATRREPLDSGERSSAEMRSIDMIHADSGAGLP